MLNSLDCLLSTFGIRPIVQPRCLGHACGTVANSLLPAGPLVPTWHCVTFNFAVWTFVGVTVTKQSKPPMLQGYKYFVQYPSRRGFRVVFYYSVPHFVTVVMVVITVYMFQQARTHGIITFWFVYCEDFHVFSMRIGPWVRLPYDIRSHTIPYCATFLTIHMYSFASTPSSTVYNTMFTPTASSGFYH